MQPLKLRLIAKKSFHGPYLIGEYFTREVLRLYSVGAYVARYSRASRCRFGGCGVTVALTVQVNDGLVIATDSAVTISTGIGDDASYFNTYKNANKIFNLVKGFPLGVAVWGSGDIGQSSIGTLIKDLRASMTPTDIHLLGGVSLDPKNYTVGEVAERVRQFIEEKSQEAISRGGSVPYLGIAVCGYSAGSPLAEQWTVEVVDGKCHCQKLRAAGEFGANWFAQTEPINRLYLGRSSALGKVLVDLGVPEENVPAALAEIDKRLEAQLVVPAMPIQDAIDLAEFLVETTVRFYRFCPGVSTVDGAIEVAAITKHEGFKWVKRKHYFDKTYNC